MKTKHLSGWATAFLPLIITATAIAFTACSGDDGLEPDPELSVTPATINVVYTADAEDIAVTSNTDWTVTVSGGTWCTALPATGTNNGTVTMSVNENHTFAARTATVTFAAGTLT